MSKHDLRQLVEQLSFIFDHGRKLECEAVESVIRAIYEQIKTRQERKDKGDHD